MKTKVTHYCTVCGMRVLVENIGPHTFNGQPCQGRFQELPPSVPVSLPHEMERRVLQYLVDNGPATVKIISSDLQSSVGNVVRVVSFNKSQGGWFKTDPTGKVGTNSRVEITDHGREALRKVSQQ